MLEVGATAPDFSLPGIHEGQPDYYNLYEPLRDDAVVVIAFAPVDFLPTATPDLAAVGEADWMDRDDVTTWAITADSLFAHEEYAASRGIEIPILTDRFASIADAYDVLLEEFRGHSEVPGHAVFVADPDWTIQFAWANDDPLVPPGESPLVGVAKTLSKLFGEDFDAPSVEYDRV